MAKPIEIKGFADLQKNIAKLQKEYPQQIAESMHRVANEIIAESDKNTSVAEGNLRNSSKVDGITKVKQTGEVNLGYSAKSAAAVHEGTVPHWMPIDPLIKWVKKKGIASGEEAESIARAIQVTISREGTKPQKFLEKAVLEKQDGILNEVKEDLKKVPRKAGLK